MRQGRGAVRARDGVGAVGNDWLVTLALVALLALGLGLWRAREARVGARARQRAAAAEQAARLRRAVTARAVPMVFTAGVGRVALSLPRHALLRASPSDAACIATSPPPALALRAAATNRAVELPIFAALRASRGRPVDPAVAALAARLTSGCETDAQRARALYDWITANIRYDWQEWANIVAGADAYTHAQDPATVLARGTTVCAGYSWLFNDLARAVGLPSTFLIGDVRGYRGTRDDELVSQFQHAWNAVQLDGAWTLLDATWGARQQDEGTASWQARRDYYFQTPANQLIFDHYPEDASWQLLATSVPEDAFLALPNLKPAFFRDGLRLGNAFSDTLEAAADQRAAILVAAPESVRLAATLSRDGQDISAGHLNVVENGTQREIVVGGLEPGSYLLRLYSKPAAVEGPYDCCADYALEIKP